MGRVGDELTLRADRPRQRVEHLVERACESTQFIRPPFVRPLAQVAGGGDAFASWVRRRTGRSVARATAIRLAAAPATAASETSRKSRRIRASEWSTSVSGRAISAALPPTGLT